MGTVVDGLTWPGIVLSLASVALSIVAIAFAWTVSVRAAQLNARTLQAIARIEKLSDETTDEVRGLIRDAWIRMLTRQTLQTGEPSGEGFGDRVEDSLVQAGWPSPPGPSRPQAQPGRGEESHTSPEPRDSPGRIVQVVAARTPRAQELLRVINENGGLTLDQYQELYDTCLGPSIHELIRSQLVRFYTDSTVEKDNVYYGVPALMREDVRLALKLQSAHDRDLAREVVETMRTIGYRLSESEGQR